MLAKILFYKVAVWERNLHFHFSFKRSNWFDRSWIDVKAVPLWGLTVAKTFFELADIWFGQIMIKLNFLIPDVILCGTSSKQVLEIIRSKII